MIRHPFVIVRACPVTFTRHGDSLLLGANPFGDLDRVWLKLPEQEIELRYAGGHQGR